MRQEIHKDPEIFQLVFLLLPCFTKALKNSPQFQIVLRHADTHHNLRVFPELKPQSQIFDYFS